jgi:hypothetical protein
VFHTTTTKLEAAAIAPELLKLGHTELYKFSKAWKRYIKFCKEHSAVLLDGQKMVPTMLASCIDSDLRKSLVCLEETEGCDDVDNVTDSNLKARLKKSWERWQTCHH